MLHLNNNPAMLTHVSELLAKLDVHLRQIVSEGLSVTLTRAQRSKEILFLPEILLRNNVPSDLWGTLLDKDLYPLYYVSFWKIQSPKLRFFMRALQMQAKISALKNDGHIIQEIV